MLRLLCWALCATLCATPALAEDDQPRLGFGEDAARTVSVAWNTRDERPAIVQYREEGEGAWREAEAMSTPWPEMERFVREAWLDDLDPATEYLYRVGDGERWSDVFSFRTAPVEPCAEIRFVALGDDRSQDDFGPSLNWGPILREAIDTEDPAFVINGGDLVEEGRDAPQWFNWLDHTGDLLARVPHLPTLGNHDDDQVDGDAAMYNRLFALPRNDVTGTEDFYFFTYGDLIVVSLSTVTFEGDGFAEQAAWLDEVLTENPRPWKVVMFHHPIYTSTLFGLLHEPDEKGQNAALVPVFDRHHVDLVLQSHNHWYQRFEPSFGGGGGDEAVPVADPSQGTVYVTTGGAGAFTVDVGDLFGALDAECAFTVGCAALRGEHHYLALTLAGNRLSVEVKATAAQNFGNDPANREVIDAFVIEKAGDERIDCRPPLPPDAGIEPDVGAPVDLGVDAAPVEADAAPPGEDAAPVERDARPIVDAAPTPPLAEDAAPPPPDARRDARGVRFEDPEAGGRDPGGCSAVGGAAPAWWLLLLLLARRRDARVAGGIGNPEGRRARSGHS